jgi:glycosyltransferase involved in cell wall biosynthesis
VANKAHVIVYVDSGSTDQSVRNALASGATVVALDTTIPFTAARARNAGLQQVLELAPETLWVQFVDGDCEVQRSWWEVACGFLEQHPQVAAVCGRRRERFPAASLYNAMCDDEWNTSVGETKACGGDVMMRIQPLVAVGLYNETLIAGEEPELCVRLRAASWKIWRLDAEMTWHDAAMTGFMQWWRRSVRCGFAYAAGAHLHGHRLDAHWVAETVRALLWGLALPAAIILALPFRPWLSLTLLALYPIQWLRLHHRFRDKTASAATHASFLLLGKFAESAGIMTFHWLRWTRKRAHLIEYK